MKKYNLAKIMKRAWELVKKLSINISEGLKKAWKEAKTIKEKFIKTVKIQKDDTAGVRKSDYLTFNLWEKYGKRRIYINDYKCRTIGYIENGEFNHMDNQGNSTEIIEDAIVKFTEKYEF